MNIHALSRKNGQIVRDTLEQFDYQCYWNVSGDGFLTIQASITLPFLATANPFDQTNILFPVPIVRSGGEIDVPTLHVVIGSIISMSEAIERNSQLLAIFDNYLRQTEKVGLKIPPTTITFNAPNAVRIDALVMPKPFLAHWTPSQGTSMSFRNHLAQTVHIAAYRAQLLGIGGGE